MTVVNINKAGQVVNITGRRITPQEARTVYEIIASIEEANNGGDNATNEQPRSVARKAKELYRRE